MQENEPGTRMYLAWQEKSDPMRFNHLFIFENEAAQARHGESLTVRQFESVYSPELVGGDVVFTDYEMIAGKPTAEQWVQKPNGAKVAAKSKRRWKLMGVSYDRRLTCFTARAGVSEQRNNPAMHRQLR